MNERKGETKRQHYVPRMILRNFSKDGKRISLVARDGRRVEGAPIATQCYGDYFYGADNVMEKSFAKSEAEMASFLGDLSPARFKRLGAKDAHDLRMFVAFQYARTRGAAVHMSRASGAFAKTMLRGSLELHRDAPFDPEELDAVEIGIENAQNEAIRTTTKALPVLFDLQVKFVTTSRTPGFVVGDHPVVAYNQFVEHHPRLRLYPTSTGLATKGLLLFMPLSPSMLVALFDPATYTFGGNSDVCTAGPLDVLALNRMQAVNALDCFYFHEDRIDSAALDMLKKARASHRSVYEKRVHTSPMVARPDGGMSQFVVVSQVEVRLGAKLSFIRTLDARSYDTYVGPCPPSRSPGLLQLAENFGQSLEEEVASRRAKRANEERLGTTGESE